MGVKKLPPFSKGGIFSSYLSLSFMLNRVTKSDRDCIELLTSRQDSSMKEYGWQQVKGKHAQYMLYFVMEQGKPSTANVAVVGFDYTVNRSQHYKYLSCNDSHSKRPLYAKKKADVKKWLLEVHGAALVAHKSIMARVPGYNEEAAQQLLLKNVNSGIVDSNVAAKIKAFDLVQAEGILHSDAPDSGGKVLVQDEAMIECDVLQSTNYSTDTDLPDLPALDNPAKVKGWSRWVEIENRDECGSWCRRFVLIDDTNPERQLVAITAVEVDSLNQCAASDPVRHGLWQTFFYQATEELGAHCFRSRREAIAWISKHFISSSQDTPSSSPKHNPSFQTSGITDSLEQSTRVSDMRSPCKGVRQDHVELPCDLDLLRWAADPPEPQMLEWALVAAAQLTEHVQYALQHGHQTNSINGHLPDLCGLLTALSCPKVSLMLLAQCSDLTAAVLELQQHPEPEIVEQAQELVAGWAKRAALVETLTKDALIPGDSKTQS